MIGLPLMLYVDPNDPLIPSVRSRGGATLLHIDALQQYLTKSEWPSVVALTLPTELAEAFSGAVIINRVFNLSATGIGSKLKEWGVADCWLNARLHGYLSAAKRLVHDMGQRGVSRCLQPLNTQWFRITREDSSIQTPRFSYAMSYEAPKLDGMKSPMQKSVWSIFDWREELSISPSEKKRHRFFVDAPIGTPVVAYYFGEQMAFYFPKEKTETNVEVYRRIIRAARSAFMSEIGEILTYVEPDGTTRFYGFSPFLQSACNSDDFKAVSESWIASLQQLH